MISQSLLPLTVTCREAQITLCLQALNVLQNLILRHLNLCLILINLFFSVILKHLSNIPFVHKLQANNVLWMLNRPYHGFRRHFDG